LVVGEDSIEETVSPKSVDIREDVLMELDSGVLVEEGDCLDVDWTGDVSLIVGEDSSEEDDSPKSVDIREDTLMELDSGVLAEERDCLDVD
jgi:hypothetical protein